MPSALAPYKAVIEATLALANKWRERISQGHVPKLPGWTLLLSLLGCLIALAILWVCRDGGLSWWIGVPTAIAVVVGGVLLERAIERKYIKSQHGK